MLDVKDDGSGGALLAVKAVPGARRDQVAGILGHRLKVRVAAPPEDGKANVAICELLARELGCRSRDIRVVHGHANPEKVLQISGVSAESIRQRYA